MADEKTALLPVAAPAPAPAPGNDKLAAEDGRRRTQASPSVEGRRRPGWPCVLPWAATLLLLLAAVRHLPFLLALPGTLAVAGSLTLHAPQHKPSLDPAELRDILLHTPSSESAAAWLRYYTSGPHLAGQNYSQAAWTRDRWAEWGAATHITAYDLYLNAPADHGLALLKPAAAEAGEPLQWDVAFRASLVEDGIDEDPTTRLADSVPTFHGYSASGNVTGPLVYVNYGTYQDYADLEKANISLQGAVALARYGGIFRGLKVKRAQELGAVGVLLYSDPGDDNGVTAANGYAVYPDGPARQPSAVQRGSVQFLSMAPGDPTTIGYPSKPGVPRGSTERYIPSIPSIPISFEDALPLLQALNGHGPTSQDLGRWWTRNEGLGYRGVNYNIGPTPADQVQVNLYNEQTYTTTPIWDVLGVFNGSVLPNEVVVVGNHRDAWIAGGAVDPNSGSAVLNEVVRAFGVAAARGWKPLRTVVFASWDGEEYGLLGSTEWVEEYLPWLKHATLAYVNTDVGVSGPHFGSSAVPLLHDLIYQVTSEVPSPNQTVPGQTVRDTWPGDIGPLGSGSDYTAFLDHAGITSIDVRFSGGASDDPVYMYHSNYDSYHWMEKYGDPGFVYHKTMAQVLGLLVAHLATDVVVPFKAGDYADALRMYVDKISEQLDKHGQEATAAADAAVDDVAVTNEAMAEIRGRRLQATAAGVAAAGTESIDDAEGQRLFRRALVRLYSAVSELATHATALDAKADDLREELGQGHGGDDSGRDGATALQSAPAWWRRLVRLVHHIVLAFRVAHVNRRYQYLERKFLYEGGLDGREWFKHVIFAPGMWTGYSGAVFPGLVESIDAGNWTNAVRWADLIEERLQNAAKHLQ